MSEISTSLKRNGIRQRILALAVILTVLIPLGSAHAQGDWAATLYTGQRTDASPDGIFTTDFSMEDAYWEGLGLTRKIYTYRHYFDLEIEGQINKFFGD